MITDVFQMIDQIEIPTSRRKNYPGGEKAKRVSIFKTHFRRKSSSTNERRLTTSSNSSSPSSSSPVISPYSSSSNLSQSISTISSSSISQNSNSLTNSSSSISTNAMTQSLSSSGYNTINTMTQSQSGILQFLRSPPPTPTRSPKNSVILETNEQEDLEFLLKVSEVFTKILKLKGNRTWAAFFHERMTYTRELLSEKSLIKWKNVFRVYGEVLMSRSEDTLEELQMSSFELFSFLLTHSNDPDNALIGLPLSERICSYYNEQKKIRSTQPIQLSPSLPSTLSTHSDCLLSSSTSSSKSSPIPSSNSSPSISSPLSSSPTSAISPFSSPRSNETPSSPTGENPPSIIETRSSGSVQNVNSQTHSAPLPTQNQNEEGINNSTNPSDPSSTTTATQNENSRSKMEVGELAVVDWNNNWLFCRLAEEIDSEGVGIAIYLDPSEKKKQIVKCGQIYHFTDEMVQNLQNEKMMGTLVADPASKKFEEIREYIITKTKELLAINGIDLELMRKIGENQASILELKIIKQYRQQLDLLLENNKEFFDDVNNHVNTTIKKFLEELDPHDLFAPLSLVVLHDLKDCQERISMMPKVIIQKYIASVESALDQLGLDARQLLNGTFKDHLTEWWLALINTEIKKFLTQRGYDYDAVPADYIETPPSDLELVKKNLEIIEEVFKQLENKESEIHKVIKSLKDQIMPKVDEFISKSKTVISDFFHSCAQKNPACSYSPTLETHDDLDLKFEKRGAAEEGGIGLGLGGIGVGVGVGAGKLAHKSNRSVTSAPTSKETRENALQNINNKKKKKKPTRYLSSIFDKTFLPIEAVEESINELKDHLKVIVSEYEKNNENGKISESDKMLFEWVGEMISDLGYLEKMKYLEENPIKSEKLVLTDVVPISGLIVGSFYRLRNELSTVLELWE